MIPYYWVGSKAYDFLSGRKSLTHSYYVSRAKALSSFPTLRADGLKGVFCAVGLGDRPLI